MIQKIFMALCLMCVTHPALAAERGYFGASFGKLPATEKVRTGVIVKKVFAGMAAKQAGIKPGEIVTQINGVFVPDPKTAVALLAENAAGERIRLTVIDRTSGQLRQSHVFVIMGANPTSEFAKIMTARPMPPPRPLSTSSAAHHCVGPAKMEDRRCPTDAAAEH